MCWHNLAALLWHFPASADAPGDHFLVGDKARFTTQGQNESIFTPSVPLTSGLMLSLHPPAPTVTDINQWDSSSLR